MERRIEEAYVKPGNVSFTYKYYPVVDMSARKGTNESHWAAFAAECANDQGKFWEYHDKLFAVWSGEFVGTFTKPKLKQYAQELGLDTNTFNQCIDTEKTAQVIQADIAEATRLNVQGTPSFFVNGRFLSINDPRDYGAFSRTFDSLLK